MPVVSDHSAARAPGRLSKALLGLFMKRATVTAIEDVAKGFRLVTLKAAALEGASWVPGSKIQVAMGSAFVARTYTPMSLDAAAGSTRILGYAQGGGPGSAWLRGLRAGEDCDIFGPRSSLDPDSARSPLAVFGDETSIGLAHALASTNRLDPMNCCFEVSDVRSVHRILAFLGLEGATLVAKREEDAHLSDMEAALGPPIAAGGSLVLTGKASTIQRLRQNLRWEGVSTARILAKAYWSPGKRGFD